MSNCVTASRTVIFFKSIINSTVEILHELNTNTPVVVISDFSLLQSGKVYFGLVSRLLSQHLPSLLLKLAGSVG